MSQRALSPRRDPHPRDDPGFIHNTLSTLRQLGLAVGEPALSFDPESGLLGSVTYTATEARREGDVFAWIVDRMAMLKNLGLHGRAAPGDDRITYTLVERRPFKHR